MFEVGISARGITHIAIRAQSHFKEKNGNGLRPEGDLGKFEAKHFSKGETIDPDDFTWSPEAMGRIEQVPKGFMRDNTSSRVLDYAHSVGTREISLEICLKGIEESVKIMTQMVEDGATLEDFLPTQK